MRTASSLEVAQGRSERIMTFGGGPLSEEDLLHLEQLSDNGYKIDRVILWWNYLPGYNLLDVFYDKVILHRLEVMIDYHIQGYAQDGKYYDEIPGMEQLGHGWLANPEKLWSVTLGDEGPGGFRDSQFYGALSPDLLKYADMYHSETGKVLKPIDRMSRLEEVVFREWLNEKTVWMLNYAYKYIKNRWPHLRIYQAVLEMEPMFGFIYDRGAPYELLSDGFVLDCYYAADHPWMLYDAIRRYKALFPDKPFRMWLWGVIWNFSQMEGDQLVEYREGDLERFRRETWISYLAGVDVLGWFDWGPQGPGSENWRFSWVRTDAEGKQVFNYTGALSAEIAKLPVLRARPVILAIDSHETNLSLNGFSDAGFFTEYDIVNERAFALSDIDLSQYRLIVLKGDRYRDETVRKINAFIENGGNVAFLGGAGARRSLYDPFTITGSGSRTELFPFEKRASEKFFAGHMFIGIDPPNILSLQLTHRSQYAETYSLTLESLTGNYNPIGRFTWNYLDGSSSPVRGYPLLLYHDQNKPDSGWVLYWGVLNSWQTADYDPNDRSDLLFLYREVFRAFAEFIGIGHLVATPETQDLISTQGMLDNGMLLAGIGNLQNRERNIIAMVDLERFGLPEGDYWVYSIDEGISLGRFSASGSILEIPLPVAAGGTRLLIISKEPFDPQFKVEIFPEIPPLGG